MSSIAIETLRKLCIKRVAWDSSILTKQNIKRIPLDLHNELRRMMWFGRQAELWNGEYKAWDKTGSRLIVHGFCSSKPPYMRHGPYRWYYKDQTLGLRCHIKQGKLHGKYKAYIKGTGKRTRHYRHGKQHGRYTWTSPTGMLLEEAFYKDGKKHGSYRKWHKNGQPDRLAYFKNDQIVGEFRSWDENGNVVIKTYYRS